MKSINRVALLGYIGNDLELKASKNRVPYCFVSIATTKAVKVGKQWEEETEWNNVSVWGHAAEFLCEYAGKGARIYFEGRVHTAKTDVDDEDGNPIYKTYIGGQHVVLLSTKGSDNDTSQKKGKGRKKGKARAKNNPPPQPDVEDDDYTEDDIPF